MLFFYCILLDSENTCSNLKVVFKEIKEVLLYIATGDYMETPLA